MVTFEQLRTILKSTGINVYRDKAPSDAELPYIIYQFVNEQHKRASNKILADMPLYQIAYITSGIESELEVLKEKFNENKVAYERFEAMPYDEDDETITQFVTYVRCIHAK